MDNFSDKLMNAIEAKGNPCIVGLDPRIDQIPEFIIKKYENLELKNKIESVIFEFNKTIIDQIEDSVSSIKPQIAFYEQYGLPGLKAFEKTIKYAKKKDLLVIVDAKRNDIGSTAEAYSNAFLGTSKIFGTNLPIFDVDAITVNPFLGNETLIPFVKSCMEYGKGMFVLVKTSNPGSGDIQDKVLSDNNEKIYENLASIVDFIGKDVIGKRGYSSIGAVVGATYPQIAKKLRKIMSTNFFLVPGYGAQGAKAEDIIYCFNEDKKGALINSSRNITYAGYSLNSSEKEFKNAIKYNIDFMIKEINSVLV